ncbi:PREDICTED: uncharacterized protein LOC109127447 [Camelina sativa]|uniref:Uncharacterized protein LOC109127447 n=1 Tax=Camelina sativa TaxID=90675 RepID=A0ABM1QLN3_CAMSA|nr:PREDICTED: uncharacterized protein LOC109127447 [Camelina sativa]
MKSYRQKQQTLKKIPNSLYSIPGISHIASGLGAPMATYKPRLDPSLMGEAKILVEVELSKAFPPRIAAVDKKGNISMVDVEYAWVPVQCGDCGQLGHKASRCMNQKLPHQKATKVVSNEVNAPANVSLFTALALVSPINLQHESTNVVIQEGSKVQDDEVAVTKDSDVLSDREVRSVFAKNKFNRLGSYFSDGDSLPSDGDLVDAEDSDSESEMMDHMPPSGQRLLRERPVQPSIKAKETQESFIARGRGQRGRRSRGHGCCGRGHRGRG